MISHIQATIFLEVITSPLHLGERAISNSLWYIARINKKVVINKRVWQRANPRLLVSISTGRMVSMLSLLQEVWMDLIPF